MKVSKPGSWESTRRFLEIKFGEGEISRCRRGSIHRQAEWVKLLSFRAILEWGLVSGGRQAVRDSGSCKKKTYRVGVFLYTGSGSWSMDPGERARALQSFDEDCGCPFGAGDGYRGKSQAGERSRDGICRWVGKRYGKDADSVVSVRGSCEYSPKLGT